MQAGGTDQSSEADRLLREVLRIRLEKLGAENPSVREAFQSPSKFATAIDEPDRAERLAEELGLRTN